jgi:hypothetical protein
MCEIFGLDWPTGEQARADVERNELITRSRPETKLVRASAAGGLMSGRRRSRETSAVGTRY